MNPFLEIPVGIVNSDKQEKNVQCRIRPSEIEYYYPGFFTGTVLVMKSGQSLLTTLSFAEIENGIDQYVAFVKKNAGKFGNLVITPVKESKKSNLSTVD